jgi:hypothetical protein
LLLCSLSFFYSSAAASSDGDYDSSSSEEGSFFSTVSNFFDLTKSKPTKKKSVSSPAPGGGLVDYINNLVQHDAQVRELFSKKKK